MESCFKAPAATASSRLQKYARLIRSSCTKGLLMGCAGFVTLACISLISMQSPAATSSSSSSTHHLSLFKFGPLPPNIRSLLAMLHLHKYDQEYDVDEGNPLEFQSRLKQVLEKASMPDRTVILTTLNGAWANEGTMINLFLESFWIGNGTQRLLQHLVFICVDEKAYERCLVIHPHCVRIKTHGVNLSQEQILLSQNYIKLVWRRIKLLKTVVEMNFNFVFTDTDVIWFRDPFPLLQNERHSDIQIASDNYNQRPWDIHNYPNSGFMYVRANKRTTIFFDYWYKERKRDSKLATQGIFNIIKYEKSFKNIGMKLYFLDPLYFGGFCTIQDTNMTKAITMHATCCKGLEAKLIDLRKILEGWKKWQLLSKLEKTYPHFLHSEGSLNNQSILQPCNAQTLDINPVFDEPSTCIQSLNK